MKKLIPTFILSVFLIPFIWISCASPSPTEPAQPDTNPTFVGIEIQEDVSFSHKAEWPTPNPNATPTPAGLTFSSGPSNSTALVYHYVEEPGSPAFGEDFELVKVE